MKTTLVFLLMGANDKQLGSLLLLFLVATLTAGIHDAWSKKRGVLGWIASLMASFVGGIVGTVLTSMALDTTSYLYLDGTPIFTICMVLGLLLGSWIAVQVVNRFR